MQVIRNHNHRVYLVKKHPMGKSFLAICLFGFVLSIRPLDADELNHELIHAAQQRELLYIPFFIWYGIEWVALYFKYKDWLQAYAHILFEKEAYRHQSDLNYLHRRKHFIIANMSRRVLPFIVGSVFLAVLLAVAFLLWSGSQVDCPTGDAGTEHADTLCTCPNVKVSLQPYGDFTQKEAMQLKHDMEMHLGMLIGEVGLQFEVLPNKPLAEELKNDAGTRYRADKIINALAKDANGQHVIIALTHKDISVSYKGKPDWGVLGLSLIPKKACVVSTFRVRNRKDLWKVVSHEFIHTCFEYQHCPDDNPKCLMKDAKGHADFSNKSTLCEKCSKRIYDHF